MLSSGSGSSSFASSLLDPSQVYRLRLAAFNGTQASSGGVVNFYYSCNPATYASWTDVSDLFAEIRLVETRISIVSDSISGDSATFRPGMMVAFDYNQTASAPGALAAVVALAGSTVVPLSSVTKTVMTQKVLGMQWASTASPVPGPYAGCYGQWVFYRSGLSTAQSYFDVLIEGIYEVRGLQ